MNPEEYWPSEMSPWEAGHILTLSRLPFRHLTWPFFMEMACRDN